MTTSVTGITADLRLETAAFIRDLSKASQAVARNTSAMQRSMTTMQRSFDTAAGVAKGFVAGLVSVQGLRALANLGRQAIDTGDEIGEAASKLGIGTEALQRFRFAAAQTDVDTVALNLAMKQFQKNLATGQIAASTGDIAGAFEEWIQKIREAPTQLAKVEIAVKAFAKQYQAALLIAAQGDIFTESMKNAFVITDRAVQIASQLDNNIRSLSSAVQTGFNTGFILGFEDSLHLTRDELVKLNENARAFGQTVATSFGGALSILIKVFDIVQKINDAIGAPGPVELANEIAGAIKGTGSTAIEPLDFGGMNKSLGIDPDAVKASTEAFVSNTKAISDRNEKITDALGRSLEFDDMLREGKSLFADMQTPLEEHASSLERLSKLYAVGAIDAETFARANQQLTLGMANNWLGAAGAVSGALTQIFKDNKAVAIANAVINTAEAITSALKNPPGPPFSFVYAAAAAAAGAAQIATILSSQPGKAKTPSVKSGSGKKVKAVKDAGEASTASTSGGITSQMSVNITLQGEGGFSREQVRGLISEINKAVGDGAVLRVSG